MRFKKLSRAKKIVIVSVSIVIVIAIIVLLNFPKILNFYVENVLGKNYTQLTGEPEVGKMYAIDIDGAVSSDGSKWQGYFKKGSENKVIVYFYGGGFSVNNYTAARSMDVEGGFYNPRFASGLNVMTRSMEKLGLLKDSDEKR